MKTGRSSPDEEFQDETEREGVEAASVLLVPVRIPRVFIYCAWVSLVLSMVALVGAGFSAYSLSNSIEYMGRHGNKLFFDSMINQAWLCQACSAVTGVLSMVFASIALAWCRGEGARKVRWFAGPAMAGSLFSLCLDALGLIASFGICFLHGFANMPHC